MSKLDQFASAFKSAAKEAYIPEEVALHKVLVVTDLDAEQSRHFADDVADFLSVLGDRGSVVWEHHHAKPREDVGDLLEEIEAERADLICCYRNLHGPARTYPFSLGAHVDVLTQATSTPVLLVPFPTDDGRLAPSCKSTTNVMVLTDHLTGRHRLIDFGVRFTRDDGTLVLAHLEDDAVFDRYMGVIGKIPAIDTDVAHEQIREQLLKEPRDYIRSVRGALANTKAGNKLDIVEVVRMGHRVADCKRLVDDHGIDLVVMGCKDEDQLAMHGLAYPLAVELRAVPLLML